MNKVSAMSKCKVLMGNVKDKNQEHVKKYSYRLEDHMAKRFERIKELEERLSLSNTAIKKEKVLKILSREKSRFEKKEKKIRDKIKYWESTSVQYSINLESL
jgi:hypothetical protein